MVNIKKSFTLFSLFIGVINCSIIDKFKSWLIKHNIKMSDNTMFDNWLENDIYIKKINDGNNTFTLAHNAYSGYSSDEFSQLMGFNNIYNPKNNLRSSSIVTKLPESVNWISKGVVNKVKNQEQCGSCWAFSTISSVESAVAIKTGILNVLSEQQLVDCDSKDHGCNGGLMDNAFTWIGSNNGVCSESEYPYTSGVTKKKSTCQTKCSTVSDTDVVKFVDIQPNSDSAMMSALVQQPVSVAIEADGKDFQLYSSGVFTGKCGTNLDHGVALVGYGNENGIDYYILRNSWGESWGSDGYMFLGKGNDPATNKPYNEGKGQCGVLGEGSYPIV
jgi:C1A family cysteine protease